MCYDLRYGVQGNRVVYYGKNCVRVYTYYTRYRTGILVHTGRYFICIYLCILIRMSPLCTTRSKWQTKKTNQTKDYRRYIYI